MPEFSPSVSAASPADRHRPDKSRRARRVAALALCLGLATGANSVLTQAGYAAVHHHTAAKSTKGATAGGKPVLLSEQPGTELDKQARVLNADDIATSLRHHQTPLVLIGSAPLSTRKGEIALFVQLQSAALCGSAGCSTDAYLHRGNDWIKILDAVSGAITILPQSHKGMYDIVIDGDDRWVWRGDGYQDTISAPPMSSLRGEIKRFQAEKGVKDADGQ